MITMTEVEFWRFLFLVFLYAGSVGFLGMFLGSLFLRFLGNFRRELRESRSKKYDYRSYPGRWERI